MLSYWIIVIGIFVTAAFVFYLFGRGMNQGVSVPHKCCGVCKEDVNSVTCKACVCQDTQGTLEECFKQKHELDC